MTCRSRDRDRQTWGWTARGGTKDKTGSKDTDMKETKNNRTKTEKGGP
jgi:hypothetical protein